MRITGGCMDSRLDSGHCHDALVHRLRSFGLLEDASISHQAALHCNYMAAMNQEVEAPPHLLGEACHQTVLVTSIAEQSVDQAVDGILSELTRKNPQLFNPKDTIDHEITRVGVGIKIGQETYGRRQAYITVRLAIDTSYLYPEVLFG